MKLHMQVSSTSTNLLTHYNLLDIDKNVKNVQAHT